MVYKVMITETQRMTVDVEANSVDDADKKAKDMYNNGECELDHSSDWEYEIHVKCPDCGEIGALLSEWVDPADETHRGLICNKCGFCTGW